MRLVNIKIQGYRRFEQPVSIDVSGDVIALVGPNESGKTSILRAMLSLEKDDDFSVWERTRRTDDGTDDGSTRVEAMYILDDEDRKALSDIPGGEDVERWTLIKVGKGLKWALHPHPPRDLSHRCALAAELERFREEGQVPQKAISTNVSVAEIYEAALAALSSDSDDLRDGEIQAIRTFASTLLQDAQRGIRLSPEFHELLSELRSYKEDASPAAQCAKRLRERRPQFVLFGAADRNLRSTYDLNQALAKTPPALENLAQLAGLDLERLMGAVQHNPGLRRKLIDDANEKLKEVFEKSWRQERLSVQLDVQGTTLEVFVKETDTGDFIEVEQRSDGLRWFVALRAFLAKHDFAVPPILLIDEAETHLHYDAQADLVNLFHEQDIAAKVIYTTHSAGCLPRDLGTGIRVVMPTGTARSTVRNSVWQDGQAGLTPLVYAMGATTFAFLPARFVLMGEGPTDAMLYPTLFREAKGCESLLFQVAPGIAVVGPKRMSELISEGGTVAFIVDGDDDGQRYRCDLERAGVPKKLIFGLDEAFGEPLELEDLVDPKLYVQAVNRLLEVFQRNAPEFSETDVPESGRTKALREWCESNGLKPLDKRKVAQELLDLKSEAIREGKEIRLLAEEHLPKLASLYDSIVTALTPHTNRRKA